MSVSSLDGVMEVVWRASWQGAVMVGVLLAVSAVLGGKLPARWRYNLWVLVLVRLALPVTPGSPVSVFNWVRSAEVAARNVETRDVEVGSGEASGGIILLTQEAVEIAAVARGVEGRPFDWRLWVIGAWGLGVVILLARAAIASVRMARRVGALADVTDSAALRLLDECRAELRVRRRVRPLEGGHQWGPTLFGFLRPRLIVSGASLRELTEDELRHVFLHELAHVKRGDVLVNWLATLLHAVHWFNPFVWVAVSRLRAERELACDELVLSVNGDANRADYGLTLLKLIENVSAPSMAHSIRRTAAQASPGTLGLFERPGQLRRRITMIARFRRDRKPWTAAGVGMLVLVAAATLTDGVRGQQTTPKSTESRPASQDQTSAAAADPSLAANANAQTPPEKKGLTFDELLTRESRPTQADVQAASKELWEREFKDRVVTPSAANKEQVNAEYEKRREALIKELVRKFPPPSSTPATQVPQQGDAARTSRRVAAATVERTVPRSPLVPSVTPESPDEVRIRAALSRRLPEVRFDAAAISDVIDFVRDVTGINILVNWRALEAAGLERSMPVTLRLKDVTLDQTFRMLEREAGGDSVRLGHAIEHGVLVFSTMADLGSRPRVEVYDIGALLGGSGEAREKQITALKAVISAGVDPSSWKDSGGEGTLSAFGDRLSITQTAENHEQIERLLTRLRQTPEAQGTLRDH